MGFASTEIDLRKIGPSRYVLLNDLVYTGKYDTFTVPAGFETDFASVPPFISALVPSDSDATLAAIVHDWFCVKLAKYREGLKKTWPTWEDLQKPPVTARDADAIFRRIMRELGVPLPRRWIMWAGVRWGALGNDARREGFLKDLTKVILISLIISPVVVPISVLTWLGLWIDTQLAKILRWFGWV